ncbi:MULTISPECIES: hypothetical protein [unclassified Mycobacterium]|uniref:hypothetical protein n=1 Tax=unclassified Mycobacterium TaxID=2642494 RepID=UPI00048B96E9|nr:MULTISPECIES: hypothetical protein [unclassified Mycobacterium]SEA31530.1 hypothetical protein SAMN04488580_102334 [Mycobacterium sp. 283mftsu]
MTLSEAKLVNAFLAFDFPGVEQLRAQARSLLVTSGCDCGCGTLNLHPVGDDLPVSDAARPVEITGDIFDGNGNAIGGVLLCPFDGLLAILEVYYWVQPRRGYRHWTRSSGIAPVWRRIDRVHAQSTRSVH